jgi:hypothetical protein
MTEECKSRVIENMLLRRICTNERGSKRRLDKVS